MTSLGSLPYRHNLLPAKERATSCRRQLTVLDFSPASLWPPSRTVLEDQFQSSSLLHKARPRNKPWNFPLSQAPRTSNVSYLHDFANAVLYLTVFSIDMYLIIRKNNGARDRLKNRRGGHHLAFLQDAEKHIADNVTCTPISCMRVRIAKGEHER